jgi:hypothetical protein
MISQMAIIVQVEPTVKVRLLAVLKFSLAT